MRHNYNVMILCKNFTFSRNNAKSSHKNIAKTRKLLLAGVKLILRERWNEINLTRNGDSKIVKQFATSQVKEISK